MLRLYYKAVSCKPVGCSLQLFKIKACWLVFKFASTDACKRNVFDQLFFFSVYDYK